MTEAHRSFSTLNVDSTVSQENCNLSQFGRPTTGSRTGSGAVATLYFIFLNYFYTGTYGKWRRVSQQRAGFGHSINSRRATRLAVGVLRSYSNPPSYSRNARRSSTGVDRRKSADSDQPSVRFQNVMRLIIFGLYL